VTGSAYKYTEVPDQVSLIRCSYCHAVHTGTNGGNGGALAVGRPYIRGTWMGNPYPEDGAPFAKNYTSKSNFGAVPRGGTAYTEDGGYFIDQNNRNNANAKLNTTTWSYANNAGLCAKCHIEAVNDMDEITGEGLWLGSNGHANAVLGGGGTASGRSTNIFDFTHGRPGWITGSGKTTQVPSQAYQTLLAFNNYGYRGSGGFYAPRVTSSRPMASYNWGAIVNTATAGNFQNQYHQFPCSKCHNPHASRLPKLLITNCLDINHAGSNTQNTKAWGVAAYTSLQSTFTAGGLTDKSKRDPYFNSAQNCHRADDGVKASNPGWNKVSPWGGAW